MKLNKQKIVLDFDDTLFKSSEQIIRMLNRKYNLNKTIKDLKDWGYTSIYSNITPKEVTKLFSSIEFFEEVEPNDGVKDFLMSFKNDYQFLICTKGNKENLKLKKEFLKNFFDTLKIKDWEFYGIPAIDTDVKLDKSSIDFSDCLFCVDDNTSALLSINTPKKILIKNYSEYIWNETPINEDNVYVINDFFELKEICEFDNKLRNEGIIIG